MSAVETGDVGALAGLGSQQISQSKLMVSSVDLLSARNVDRSMKEFWEVSYKPNEPLDHKGTYTFNIPGLHNSFVEPSSIRLTGAIQVLKSIDNGSNYKPLEEGDEEKVTLINFAPQMMFSGAHVVVNGASISHVGTSEYAYKTYFENLCSFSEDAAKYHLVTEGYLPDCAVSDQSGTSAKSMHMIKDGAGNEKRGKWLSKSKLGFNMPLHIDFCNVGRLWLDLVPMQICLTMNDDKFSLLTEATSSSSGSVAPLYKIAIVDLNLECRRIGLIDSIKETIESHLQRKDGANMVRYPLTKSTVKRFHIPKDSTEFSWSCAETGKLPHHVIAAFVDQEAASGHLQKNPLAFEHFNLKELAFNFNNVDYPSGRYLPCFDVNDYTSINTYGKVLDNLTTARGNCSTMITHERWKAGNYTVFCTDQSPDSCSGFHAHSENRGALSITGRFKEKLTKNVTLLLYCAFNDELRFDSERRVYGEGAVLGQ